MNSIQKYYNNEKLILEKKLNSIKDKKSLDYFNIFFKLSEVKNIIRKNCLHKWSKSDLEMGNMNNQYCLICNAINYYHHDF